MQLPAASVTIDLSVLRPFSRKRGLRCHCAAILESFLAVFILLILFFGVLQVYRLALADMITEYAAFRAARTAAVGFDDYLVDREARVKAVPVSGDMTEPEPATSYSSVEDLYYAEKEYIESYLDGERWLEYANWDGCTVRHNNYRCPYYGQSMTSGTCDKCGAKTIPHLGVSNTVRGDTADIKVQFRNYPLNLPLYEMFSEDGTITIQKNVKLTNYAQVFLDE